MLKKQSKNAKITLSILFVFIGLVLISFNYFDGIKNNLFNDKNIKLMNQTISIYEEIKEINEDDYNNYIFDEPTDEYIGTLIIDKIDLNRGFYSIDSKYNNVDQNIMVVETSNMPNITNGNLILASHSGSSSISFFKKLYLLELNDTAKVKYKNRTYNYKLVNIYTDKKDGDVVVSRDANSTILTLITCTKNDNTTQTIYIFELQNIEK